MGVMLMPVGKSWDMVVILFLHAVHDSQTNARMPTSTQAKGLEL